MNQPWYLERSRGGTMSPTMAIAMDISPPAPMPCTARKAASAYIDPASPHSAEPATKAPIAKR